MVHILLWVVSLSCFVFGIPFVFLNWQTVFTWLAWGKRSSWVPGIGGISVGIGIATIPLPSVRSYWWLSLLLDCGRLPAIVYSLLYL